MELQVTLGNCWRFGFVAAEMLRIYIHSADVFRGLTAQRSGR